MQETLDLHSHPVLFISALAFTAIQKNDGILIEVSSVEVLKR